MNFDLNIENYTKNELREMFDLPSNYDTNIIKIKETKLIDSINNNREINKEIKINTINFITKAKNILLNDSSVQEDNKDEKSEKEQKKTFLKNIESLYHFNYDLKPSELENTSEHMVQVRQDKPYITSSPAEFITGVINPLKKRTIKQNLNIDTRFRENYYSTLSTNFTIGLPVNFTDILSMQLAAIELPITYYNVSKQYNNNFFTVKINNVSGVVNIPDGNYTDVGIINTINNQLQLLGGDFGYIVFIVNINNNSGSGQTMVGLDGGLVPAVDFEINFQADRFGNDDRNTPLPLKLGWLLGFRNGIYINNQNYVSEGILNVSGPRYAYLVVDDYNNNVNNGFYSAFNSSILNKNILARISLQTNVYNILIQNNLNIVTSQREYFGPVNINNLTIQLLDEYGRIIDLNNMDYSFCLNLITVYDI